MKWAVVSYFYNLVQANVGKTMKENILTFVVMSLVSLSVYLLIGSTLPYQYYFIYFIILIIIDLVIPNRISKFGLYFVVPILSILLLLFDPTSIFRSLKYIIMCPLLYFVMNKVSLKISKVFLSIAVISLGCFIAVPNWESFYKSINNPTKELSFQNTDLQLYDINGNTFNPNNENPIILDFWYSGCGQCFKDMKKINKLLNEHPNLRSQIYTVNVPLRNETQQANYNLVKDFNLNYLYTKRDFEFLEKHGITEFPKQILLDKQNGKILNVSTNPMVVNLYIPNLLE